MKRHLVSALLSASLVSTGAIGCSDDDDKDGNVATPDGGVRDGSIDSGNTTLLDAALDATKPDASTQSPTDAVSSKAADLAVTINRLLGEHLILAAKATGTALRGAESANEFKAYGDLLNKNGTELGDLVGSAFGDAAKTSFNGVWSAHNGFFVAYTTGVATNNETAKAAAINDLNTKYVVQFSTLVATATGLPLTAVQPLVEEHVRGTKAIVDAQGAGDWAAAYAAIRAGFAHMKMLGNPLAQGVAKAQPANYPGDAASKAALFRVDLNQLLQEHLFLATFATDAAIQGKNPEFTAASNALNTNGTDIGAAVGKLFGTDAQTSFNTIWSAHNGYFVEYTTAVAAGDATAKAAAVTKLTTDYAPKFSALLEVATGTPAATWQPGVLEHVTTTAAVVDAQQTLQTTDNEANATAAAKADRDAGHHMQDLADPLAKGIVGKVPGQF